MSDLEQELAKLEAKLSEAEKVKLREAKFLEEANKRFNDNLSIFQKHFPELAENIKQYQCNEFELHVTVSGHGNLKEESNDAFLYGDNPLEQCQDQVKRHIANPAYTHMDFSGFDAPQESRAKDQRTHARFMYKFGELFRELENESSLTSLPDRFPSCVMFGVGLGYHLEELFKQKQFDHIFLYEPDFKVFYSSLFCISWVDIIEKIDSEGGCLYINIGSSAKQFFNDLFIRAIEIGYFSIIKTFIYQHYPSNEMTEIITEFRKRFFEFQSGWGFFNDGLVSTAHTLNNVLAGHGFLKPRSFVKGEYADIPVFVIGNGPSLDECESILKSCQDKALIFSAGSSIVSLDRMGVKADFHSLIERPKFTYDVLIDTWPKEKYKEVNLLTANVIYPEVTNLYKWTGLALKPQEAGTELFKVNAAKSESYNSVVLRNCNPLVSNTSLSYAINLGFRNIYLIGVDNGYQSEKNHHSKYSFYFDKNKNKNIVAENVGGNITHEGNLGGTVTANKLSSVSNTQMDAIATAASAHGTKIFKIGSGAKIDNVYPLSPENFIAPDDILDKESIIENVKSLFVPSQIESPEELADPDHFFKVCQHLIDISNESFDSAEDALDIMRRQSRYLYSLKGTKYSHHHMLMEGSLLYFHCGLVSLLYGYQFSENLLRVFRKGMLLWSDFLNEASEEYKKDWNQNSTYGLVEYNGGTK